jgi:hypothetical protein
MNNLQLFSCLASQAQSNLVKPSQSKKGRDWVRQYGTQL